MDDTPETSKTITKEDIAAERNARIKLCGQELSAVLEKHSCALTAQPFITPQGVISAQIGVTDKPE